VDGEQAKTVALIRSAELEEMKGDAKGAAKLLQQAKEICPTDMVCLRTVDALFQLYFRNNMKDQARNLWKEAQQKWPGRDIIEEMGRELNK